MVSNDALLLSGRRPRPILPPLTDVIIGELGISPGRRRTRSGHPYWRCPFHDDHDPSLTLTPDGEQYHCFGCRAGGDAIDFIRRLHPGMSYPEAVAYLAGAPATPRMPRPL